MTFVFIFRIIQRAVRGTGLRGGVKLLQALAYARRAAWAYASRQVSKVQPMTWWTLQVTQSLVAVDAYWDIE